MIKDQVREYRAGSGKLQYKPSFELAMEMGDDGFCLACGEIAGGVEPDAQKYKCPNCGELKVYGGEQLVAMGLAWT